MPQNVWGILYVWLKILHFVRNWKRYLHFIPLDDFNLNISNSHWYILLRQYPLLLLEWMLVAFTSFYFTWRSTSLQLKNVKRLTCFKMFEGYWVSDRRYCILSETEKDISILFAWTISIWIYIIRIDTFYWFNILHNR